MIHYHCTPITPRAHLLEMRGSHFCVSHLEPRDIDVCLEIGQSVMLDNGAFSVFTRGLKLDFEGYCAWVDQHLQHPHWAIIPDVIGGSVEDQRAYLSRWQFPRELSAPVFHLHLPFEWLAELIDSYPKICLGSSAQYWQVGSPSWERRMDEIFEFLCRRKYLPWIHGLRMLGMSSGRWPLASADSSNVARNHNREASAAEMAWRLDGINPSKKFRKSTQIELFAE